MSLKKVFYMVLKFDVSKMCHKVVQEILRKQKLKYSINNLNEIEFENPLSKVEMDHLIILFQSYGIEIVEDTKITLVQQIKDVIISMVWNKDGFSNLTTSVYLSDELHHSYGYLSNLFSQVTGSTIENYIIFQKIERAKSLSLDLNLTLTEISYILNYSSVAHLSGQFKKTTGFTPSSYIRIMNSRKESKSDSEN
jgi:AraC-like DNA-binding protein